MCVVGQQRGLARVPLGARRGVSCRAIRHERPAMPRHPIGTHAMSGAERSRRARAKARQAREAASHTNTARKPPVRPLQAPHTRRRPGWLALARASLTLRPGASLRPWEWVVREPSPRRCKRGSCRVTAGPCGTSCTPGKSTDGQPKHRRQCSPALEARPVGQPAWCQPRLPAHAEGRAQSVARGNGNDHPLHA